MGEWLGSDPSALSSLLFDLLIIAVVGGLWLMWARSLNRQKNIEGILAATSGQLEEASRHLQSALAEIQRLQAGSGERDTGKQTAAGQAAPEPRDPARTGRQPAPKTARHANNPGDISPPLSHPMHAYRRAATPQPSDGDKTKGTEQAAVSPKPEDDVQRIIRLNELGSSAEDIATRLDLPLARVNLLLRLHRQQVGQATPDGGPVAG